MSVEQKSGQIKKIIVAIEKIETFKKQKDNLEAVRSLLGMTSFFERFIEGYATVAEPLIL